MSMEKYPGEVLLSDLNISAQNYYRSVFAGSHLLYMYNGDRSFPSEFSLGSNAEGAFKAACLPYVQKHKDPKYNDADIRVFHNIDHPLESSGRAVPDMKNVHDYIKSRMPDDVVLGMEEAAKIYYDAMQCVGINAFVDRKKRAAIDVEAMWHDVVYGCDERVQRDVFNILASEASPLHYNISDSNFQWRAETVGGQDYLLLQKLDWAEGKERYVGPYPVPNEDNGVKTQSVHNEVLSAIAAKVALEKMGVDSDNVFAMYANIINTVPFKSVDFHKKFERAVTSGFIDGNKVDGALEVGRLFCNGADIANIINRIPDSGEPDIFGRGSWLIARENNPVLKEKGAAILGSELAEIVKNGVGFSELALNQIQSGQWSVVHTINGELDSEQRDANNNAVENFARDALIGKARYLAVMMLDCFLPAGKELCTHVEEIFGKGDAYRSPISGINGVNGMSLEEEIAENLLKANPRVYGEGAEADLPIDRFAGDLLRCLRRTGVDDLYATLQERLRQRATDGVVGEVVRRTSEDYFREKTDIFNEFCACGVEMTSVFSFVSRLDGESQGVSGELRGRERSNPIASIIQQARIEASEDKASEYKSNVGLEFVSKVRKSGAGVTLPPL